MNPARLYVMNQIMWLLLPTRCWGMKRLLFRWAGADVGEKVRIVSAVRIHMSGSVLIGSDTLIGHEVMILGGNAPIPLTAARQPAQGQ